MKKSLYIVYYYTSEEEKDFETIVHDSNDMDGAQKAWLDRFNEEYEQDTKASDVVGVYEITQEGQYKITCAEKANHHTQCPLCEEELKYELHNETHIYVCQGCSFVGFEYLGEKDTNNISARLNRK